VFRENCRNSEVPLGRKVGVSEKWLPCSSRETSVRTDRCHKSGLTTSLFLNSRE